MVDQDANQTANLRGRREALVREHMELENRHDYEATLETFGHPRYPGSGGIDR